MKLTIELEHDASGDEPGWFVRVPELPGCMSQGATITEALAMILDAMKLWLSVASSDSEDKEQDTWLWLTKGLK